MIEFTTELHNHLVDMAARRVQSNPKKMSKRKIIEMQAELFCGAITAIDFLNGQFEKKDGKTCGTPLVIISVMRGDLIRKI